MLYTLDDFASISLDCLEQKGILLAHEISVIFPVMKKKGCPDSWVNKQNKTKQTKNYETTERRWLFSEHKEVWSKADWTLYSLYPSFLAPAFVHTEDAN